jgi:hypothetical protein
MPPSFGRSGAGARTTADFLAEKDRKSIGFRDTPRKPRQPIGAIAKIAMGGEDLGSRLFRFFAAFNASAFEAPSI